MQVRSTSENVKRETKGARQTQPKLHVCRYVLLNTFRQEVDDGGIHSGENICISSQF